MAEAPKVNSSDAKRAVFDELSLPIAVGNLFLMNNYDVSYDVHINGAQVDIVAQSKSDPFSSPVYIEATVEYVNNAKYSKDSTKFLLIRELRPDAKLVCLSSTGFTADVKERATRSRVETLTYDELFSRFEKFTPYLNSIINNHDIISLATAYEEPLFSDTKGTEPVSEWLRRWKSFASVETKWLIVLGEYGTGKTTLTRILQHRWLAEYHANPALPIPIRIELRNFSRQFDARGLLHHFLDTNSLSHVPIEFLMFLIKNGRVILLLDGYDEMAQFLNSRERRACLSALAELSADGAKGILTSRPNYFTDTEELNVFEALYTTLEQNKMHLSKSDRSFIASELEIDNLVERYILEKYERVLQDLTPEQTKSLVERKLRKNPKGQRLVLAMLDRVFREELDGTKQALSGKPVIISYLLEIVEDINPDEQKAAIEDLTEWQVYKLIVDRLMIRDMQRTAMSPITRRKVLQKLALKISGKDKPVADEQTFQDIISEDFNRELRVLAADERQARRLQIFEDLRSSATLTRAAVGKTDGWVFSHNSLREFLVAELMLERLVAKEPIKTSVPVSAAMRGFVASIGDADAEAIWQALTEAWPRRASGFELGPYINLLWERARKTEGGAIQLMRRLSGATVDATVDFNDLSLRDIDFTQDVPSGSVRFNFESAVVVDCSFDRCDMRGSKFEEAVFDNVSFKDCTLQDCSFRKSLLFDCDLTGADLKGSDFSLLEKDSTIIIDNMNGIQTSVSGDAALGYLKWHGATVGDVDKYYVLRFHPKYPIVAKILEKISSQKNSQKRGLTQRGEAQSDPPFARGFIDHLESRNWITVDKNDLIKITDIGRPEILKTVNSEYMSDIVADYLQNRL